MQILLFVLFVLSGVRIALYAASYPSDTLVYDARASSIATTTVAAAPLPKKPERPRVVHVATPKEVKALYLTSWVAGTKNIRGKVLDLLDTTEANAIVIDVKDYTGKIAFEVDDPELKKIGSEEVRVRDMRELIAELHEKDIYVIGRISVFQDQFMTDKRPDLAVIRESDGGVWRDRKGIAWLDAGSREVWEYVAAIGHESYKAGFDELNFDYIRFPSDGDMQDIAYRFYNASTTEKSVQLEQFFRFLDREFEGTGAVLSADLFGLTTSADNDLGIGQILEKALPHFDYVAPMIYPSHYPAGFFGFKNPADHPYDVIKLAMEGAIAKAEVASSTKAKLRPWLQDFNLGATYDAAMIRAQKKALYDLGINSWMMWSPSNNYTRGGLESR